MHQVLGAEAAEGVHLQQHLHHRAQLRVCARFVRSLVVTREREREREKLFVTG